MPEENIIPIVLETGGYMHLETEEALRKLTRRVDKAEEEKRTALYNLRRPKQYGQRLRELAEEIGMAQQVGNATLMLRYLKECVPEQSIPGLPGRGSRR